MMMAIMDMTLTRSTRKETKLEPVFVKHYAPPKDGQICTIPHFVLGIS